MVDYNDCVFYYGKIFERRVIKTSLLNAAGKNYKENFNVSIIENYNTESKSSLNFIENITAKDIYCGVNLIAIIDLFGNLFFYNEEENLCKVKITKPIQSVKFLNSNLYGLSEDKDTIFEFIHKGANFSFTNYIEKTYSIDKDFIKKISLIELPFYTNLLFFLVECAPSKKDEIERKEKSIFTQVKNGKKEYSDKFHTDDESNISLYKDCNYLNNTKTELSRISKYSETFSKKEENLSFQSSRFEDVSVFPPNRVKIKNKSLNREYSYQSETSSRLSSSNTRINKISDLLGKIFNRKLSQISTLNNQSINPSGGKKLIDIEKCLNVVPFNKKQEILMRKNEKENSISKISVTEKNLSLVNSPSEILNRNKFTEKKFVLSPQTSTLDDKQKKTNFSNVNEYNKIVKKLNFNNCNENDEDNLDMKQNKINIIKLDLTKIKKFEKGENLISNTTNNSLQKDLVSIQRTQTNPNLKLGFNSDTIKICSITDNSINLNLKENKKNLQINKSTINHIEVSIISNRDNQVPKDSHLSLSRYNSNGKSTTTKNYNVANSCDMSHVSNGKPEVNSHTEEINEQNSEVFNKEREIENSIQNIASESFNIQIKNIFFDDSVNMGTLAYNDKNIIATSEKNDNSSVYLEMNQYKRNKQKKIPRPTIEMKNENTGIDVSNIKKNISYEVDVEKINNNKLKTPIVLPRLNLNEINCYNSSAKTNGNHVDLITPEKSSQSDICQDRINQDNMVFTISSPFKSMITNKEILCLEKGISEEDVASVFKPHFIENETREISSNENFIQDLNGNNSIIKKLKKECFINNKNNQNTNDQLINENTPLISVPSEKILYTTENKIESQQPSQLYKRKSSISSFRTAKKDINLNKNISLGDKKEILVAIKHEYDNPESTHSSEVNQIINRKIEDKIFELETRQILLESTKSSPQVVIKKIVEINNLDKIEKNLNFVNKNEPNKIDSNTELEEINSPTKNKLIPSSNYSSQNNLSKILKSSDWNLSIENINQEIQKLKFSTEYINTQSYLNKSESLNEDDLSKNHEQVPENKKENKEIRKSDKNEGNIIPSSFRKTASLNHIQTMNKLMPKQKISEMLTKDKISNMKTFLLTPTPATKISNKSLKVTQVYQNIEPPKTIPHSNFYQNHFSTANLRVIDPIIEEEAHKENSFLTNYNPNSNSEDKSKRENKEDKPVNGNEILIKDFVMDDTKNSNNKENFEVNNANKPVKPKENEKNTSIINENIESARAKDKRKLLSPSKNKIQLNTFTSIIQNCKKNSPELALIPNYSVYAKSKETNTSYNTTNFVDISTLRENTLSPEKKPQDSNSKLKTIDLRSIKNIKVSPNTSVVSNSNKNRIISNSNTNYRGSIINKDNKRSGINVSAIIPRNINDISNINNTTENMISLISNNITENIISINESNLNENESRINSNKSNTNSILSLKMKQDVKNKASPKQIKINYLKSADTSSDLSKTVDSFKKRNTMEKSRKSSILSKVKFSAQSTNSFDKNKRNSAFELHTASNIDKVVSQIQQEAPNCSTEKFTEGNQSSNHSSISPKKKNKKEESFVFNTKSTAVKLDPKSLINLNHNNRTILNHRNKDDSDKIQIHDKLLSLNDIKLGRNENKSSININEEFHSNVYSNSNIKISNFIYKNLEDNIRYTESNVEPDDEIMTKYLKDLYVRYKENDENKETNFEEYVKKIISKLEKSNSNKTQENLREIASSSYETENIKFMEKEQNLKSYLKSKLKDGNISPKLTFCLTPTRHLNDDDYRDKTNIFEPIELDKSQVTQRSINLSYRKSSSLPHTTNSLDFSNSSSPKKFLMLNESVTGNIQPFMMNEDRDVRYTNRILLKRGTFSYVSNDLQILKLNSIRENAVENEYSPTKHSNESASSERIRLIENHTQ